MYVTKHRVNLHVLLNLIFWLGMYVFWLGFNQPAMPNLKINILFTLVDFCCFISIALLTSYWLIPRFLYKRQYFRFGLCYLFILFSITSIMVFCNYLMLKPYRPEQDSFSFDLNDLAGSYLLAFFLSAASSLFNLVHDFYKSQSTIIQLREDKIKTELEFLKLQVNPHSFFNILNTIYFQIDLDKESAKKTVLLFSNMFRYQLYECESEKVPMDKEIQFLDDYVQISKTRYDLDYKIQFEVKKQGNPIVAPFLLFPLVENSFKHVSQYNDKINTIDILVKYNDKQLECAISNTADNTTENVNGIGLKNLKRRLDLVYKDRYALDTKFENGMYETHLTILL